MTVQGGQKRLILHVGPHKTGSTYLQKMLVEARGRLAELGASYPEIGITIFGHHQIVDYLRGWKTADDTIGKEETRSKLAEQDLLILSSENCVFLNDDQLRNLAEMFPEHEIEVIFFLRSLTGIWPSHWQEIIKHGEDLTFLEYLAEVQGWRDSFDAEPINPLLQLEKFCRVFGFANVRCISYDNLRDTGQDVFDFFWRHVLKLPFHGMNMPEGAVNASFPPFRVEAIRYLNQRYRREEGESPGLRLREIYRINQRDYEGGDFEAFQQDFEAVAVPLTLSHRDAFIERVHSRLMRQYGSLLMNRNSDTELYFSPNKEKVVTSAHRDWPLSGTASDWMNHVYADILGKMA